MFGTVTNWLFSPAGLTAHGFCPLWEPWLIWTSAGADAITGIAYYTIPIALAVYARKRSDIMFRRVLWLFATFILLCGSGHLIELLTLWVPAYRLEAIVKMATAAVSAVTAAAVWRLLPRAVALPSPRAMREANEALRGSLGQMVALARSHERLHNVIQASPTALVLTRADGQIVMVNANAERMFGYDPAELPGLALEVLLPERLRTHHVELRTEFLANLTTRAMGEGRDLAGLRKDGTSFPIEIGLSPIEIDGAPCVLAGITDTTARCESERAMQERQRALERSNAELIRARLRAEQATRAKSRFLAGMSHELRTPLNGILGYAELLGIDGDLSPKHAARVHAMREAGTHLLHMINSVLDLSKIEAGEVTLQAEVMDPRQVARHCIEVVMPGAAAKGLAVGLDIAADIPARVVADPTRLCQVLLNLLGNAVKFTGRGTVDLRLRLSRTAGGATTLLVEIADTGRGIPADRRSELFQDFERLGADADAANEGAGLGLAISARLVALMGGRLAHGDNEGGGSIFSFALPLALPETEPEFPRAAGMPDHATATWVTPQAVRRILVVDDIAMNRDIASAFLCAAGHLVTCAEGGAQAVSAAGAADWDVVLMDLRMPEMDGFEATRRIHALGGARGRVPIVALTAHAFAEQIEACRQAGMVGHLAKPFTQAGLLEAVSSAARSSSADHHAAAAAANDASSLAVVELDTFETSASFLSPSKVASYLETITDGIENLTVLLAARDTATEVGSDIVDAAHRLAGTVGLFGFVRLTAAARGFERAARTGAANVPDLTESLRAALEVSLPAAKFRLAAARTAVAACVTDAV